MAQKSIPYLPKAGKGEEIGTGIGLLQKEIELNRRYFIIGERRLSSYWWASVFLVGGFGFLITGISSYIQSNLFTNVYKIIEVFINKSSDFFLTLKKLLVGFLLSFPPLLTGVAQQGEGNISEIGSNSQSLLQKLSLEAHSSFILEGTGGESLIFFPQGLLLCFYGSLAILLSLYWWLLIYWNVGGGFNEFNKKEGFMRIFRWGYPGKNRRIDIVYPLRDIEAIRVELNQSPGSSLLTAEQTIFVRLLSTPSQNNKPFPTNGEEGKGSISPLSQKVSVGVTGPEKVKEKREIPLGGIGQPLTLKEIEKQASELANYLQVALEGL